MSRTWSSQGGKAFGAKLVLVFTPIEWFVDLLGVGRTRSVAMLSGFIVDISYEFVPEVVV